MALTAVAFLGSTPIGGPITGLVGDHLGAEWSLAYGSLIALATAAVATTFLRTRRTLMPAPAGPAPIPPPPNPAADSDSSSLR